MPAGFWGRCRVFAALNGAPPVRASIAPLTRAPEQLPLNPIACNCSGAPVKAGQSWSKRVKAGPELPQPRTPPNPTQSPTPPDPRPPTAALPPPPPASAPQTNPQPFPPPPSPTPPHHTHAPIPAPPPVYYSPSSTVLAGREQVYITAGFNRWGHLRKLGPAAMKPPGPGGQHHRVGGWGGDLGCLGKGFVAGEGALEGGRSGLQGASRGGGGVWERGAGGLPAQWLQRS